MSSTTNWKNSERYLARIFQKYGMPAYRKTRAGNYSISDTDIGFGKPGEPDLHSEIKADSKYTEKKPFRHHGLWKIIKKKYCKKPGYRICCESWIRPITCSRTS